VLSSLFLISIEYISRDKILAKSLLSTGGSHALPLAGSIVPKGVLLTSKRTLQTLETDPLLTIPSLSRASPWLIYRDLKVVRGGMALR
jgi:hypothetical protein